MGDRDADTDADFTQQNLLTAGVQGLLSFALGLLEICHWRLVTGDYIQSEPTIHD
jgi:hypothetical protein